MCGIVGAVAQRNIVPILIEGLKRLEYRGYDSAGIAVIHHTELQRVRSEGRVADLEAEARRVHLSGYTGIGHTRWATHGEPTERNAHPHFSHDEIGVVHNGIIENHQALRQRLTGMGYEFRSETDTEVIAHLIHLHYRSSRDLLAATRSAIAELEGAFAIGVVSRDSPNRLIGARLGSPLIVGLGIEENFLASDASALLPVTQRVMYLEEGDLVDVGLLDVRVEDAHGQIVTRAVHTSELSAEVTDLGDYRHFMQKEIHEQPRAVANTLELLGVSALAPNLFGNLADKILADTDSVLILACGTSFHAGLSARYWIEELAGVPVTVEIASEYRYRQSVPRAKQLVVAISQSGETADTLAAVKHARALGHRHALSICNVPESALMRLADLRFLTRAGPEIGVASTKAFTTQLVTLYLLAGVLAKQRGRLSGAAEMALIEGLRHLPNALREVLKLEDGLREWAEHISRRHNALFIGRGMQFPIALEGALKLKEISYIHAEAYAAGELKHGPLALVDEEMPVIALAPHDALLDKMKSNIEEVRARKGDIYVLAEPNSGISAGPGIHVLELPAVGGALAPIIYALPLQLLAYHAALCKGTDVDKPRNLAKSVTVE